MGIWALAVDVKMSYTFLGAFEAVLAAEGAPIEVGKAVQAALAVYLKAEAITK